MTCQYFPMSKTETVSIHRGSMRKNEGRKCWRGGVLGGKKFDRYLSSSPIERCPSHGSSETMIFIAIAGLLLTEGTPRGSSPPGTVPYAEPSA